MSMLCSLLEKNVEMALGSVFGSLYQLLPCAEGCWQQQQLSPDAVLAFGVGPANSQHGSLWSVAVVTIPIVVYR
jgi:hypothetical protein